MGNELYYVWLQSAIGYGVNIPEFIRMSSAKDIYDMRNFDGKVFNENRKKRLLDKDLTRAKNIIDVCTAKGYRVLTLEDRDYPNALRNLNDAPLVLYVNGDIDFNSEVMIGIVGTRKASRYSVDVVSRLSYSLSVGGFTVVSGGALGVDSAAHKGAILAQGKTVAVLGCGLDYDYLRANKTLRESVSVNGALVSEFPPDYPAGVGTFPIRNRIISGLSLGVIVAEANLRSGSLITAKHARIQGKDVFAIPGGIYNESFKGVNQLLRDGAKPVYSAEDIFSEYEKFYPDKLNRSAAEEYEKSAVHNIYEVNSSVKVKKHDVKAEIDFTKVNYPKNLSDKARTVYDAMELGEIHVNDICEVTGLSLGEVLSEITLLELEGHIRALPGKRYMQNK